MKNGNNRQFQDQHLFGGYLQMLKNKKTKVPWKLIELKWLYCRIEKIDRAKFSIEPSENIP